MLSTAKRWVSAGLLGLALVVVGSARAELSDLESIRLMAEAGRTEQARQRLDELIEADPLNAQPRFFKGLMLLDSGDVEGAQAVFKELTRMFPRLPEAFNNLAVIYASRGEYDKAEVALASAAANAPEYATVQANLGDLYTQMAANAYRRALDLDPEDRASAAKLRLIEQLFTEDG